MVIDCFHTDTVDYADIVLPAASFLEFNDLTFSYFHMLMGVHVEALGGRSLAGGEADSISHMDFAEELSDQGKFQALFSWNTNPVASVPNHRQFCNAMLREDLFTVVIDCFHTDTVDYADEDSVS